MEKREYKNLHITYRAPDISQQFNNEFKIIPEAL